MEFVHDDWETRLRTHTGFSGQFCLLEDAIFGYHFVYAICRFDSMDEIELDSSIAIAAAVRICLTLPKFTDA